MSDKKKLIFVTVAASVGFWYWWNYMRKKEVPPVPPAPPVAPVPPSATYKIGDRVTYVLPRNDKGRCKTDWTYIGSICGRNPDGTYNVSWDAFNLKPYIGSDNKPCLSFLRGTIPKTIFHPEHPFDIFQNPTAVFGTCGKGTILEEGNVQIPDHFTTEQLKPLQPTEKVLRTITVANRPELCIGSQPSNVILHGTRCPGNPKRVNWIKGVSTQLRTPSEYENQFREGKCTWERSAENATEITSLFGDCTKGSVLLDPVLPFENDEKDLYPSEPL